MTKNSTSQDLIRYAYNETDMFDADRIQRSLDADPVTQDEFNDIVSVLNLLDQSKLQPSENSIEKILRYSNTV